MVDDNAKFSPLGLLALVLCGCSYWTIKKPWKGRATPKSPPLASLHPQRKD